MKIGVPRETVDGERRVAVVPEAAGRLAAAGLEVAVESGAGVEAGYPDGEYTEAGARLEPDTNKLWSDADLIAKVQPPSSPEVDRLREGAYLVCVLDPYRRGDTVKALAGRRVGAFSLDLMPRITRAQSMDVLSAMSTITGYKSVLLAANALDRLFPMLMTAAGTIKPARVLVLGAGVAGLQAIATARRLGAVVEAYDIRPAAKEQVESLGARFVEVADLSADAEDAGGYAKEQTAEQQARARDLLTEHISRADAVITTALVPGRPAPKLIAEDQVRAMKPGSVVIDLAAESGGNCESTRPGEVVRVGGADVHGPLHVASELSFHASQLFARTMTNYLLHLAPEGELVLNLEDEVTRAPLVTHEGRIAHDGVRDALEG